MPERSEHYQMRNPSTGDWHKFIRRTGERVETSDERFEGLPEFEWTSMHPKEKEAGW